ncbi:MAG: hypothetical protein IPJ30_13965 [Acidobacteria bacterium]|nr:hypothetical protein [Acidobacteriota bacterium]
MRLTVRREQMEVMETVAQAGFERRLADRIRAEYPLSVVKLPDGGEFPAADLSDETLHKLVAVGIARARGFSMKQESAIAGFVALMFDVSPNFDKHRLCQVLLTDDEHEPDERLGPMLDVLTDANWESIRKDYDPSAWEEKTEPIEAAPDAAKPETPAAREEDIGEKTVIVNPAETPAAETIKPPVPDKPRGVSPDADFGLETMIDTPKPDKMQKTMRGGKKKIPSEPDFGLDTVIIKRED